MGRCSRWMRCEPNSIVLNVFQSHAFQFQRRETGKQDCRGIGTACQHVGDGGLRFALKPVLCEHGGETLPGVFASEGAAVSWIKSRVAKGTVLNADEASSWNDLHSRFEVKPINHQGAYSLDGACTNWAESYFARLRRGEAGHHHISGAYLLRYAQEAAWREDNRRSSNGDQTRTVAGLAMRKGPSVDFSGYWQRHVKAA